ncbi:MAG: ATP-binding protein [Syntrophorhabdaceae bacterium]|nr:ATP-binding protein [Syntrophorhabdaceae bacterium]
MKEEKDPLLKKIHELELELEDAKSLSMARNRLLEANISELNDVYGVLNEKLKEIRKKDERIRDFANELIRANKLSVMGELAGSIAHEIKNPLISIQGFAKRIVKTEDIEKIKKYARLIDSESGRLSNVLVKLLEFSRMDEPEKVPININEVVDDTVLFMEHYLTRFKNIEVILDKGENLPPILADKIHIQQALVNIMMNAAQAMPKGGAIKIKTGEEEGYVYVSVTDKGTGIKPEDMERLFDPFFTTKKKGEGTGLGLSLVKRLVDAHKGKIHVESKLGEGSTFKILIPHENTTPSS